MKVDPPGSTAWFVNLRVPDDDTNKDGDGLTDSYGYRDSPLVLSSNYQKTESSAPR